LNIRVLTYNIHRAIGFDRRFDPERIIKILQGHDADIVLLQEVDEGAPRSRELKLAKELADALDYPHYAMGHNVTLRKGRYGNATLSRFPILRERNIDLTVGIRKRRGCQHTTIGITDEAGNKIPLEVFNLHLGLSARERQKQAGILAHSKEFSSLDINTPCLTGGDFNDWRSLLRAFYIEGLGFQCATDKKNTAGQLKAIKTFPSFAPRGGLDRIYYRGKIDLVSVKRCRFKASKIASDHLPVIADFDLLIKSK
jgi:endonuclease/exonuclease/phosphatase family metal-dependent hydrolase